MGRKDCLISVTVVLGVFGGAFGSYGHAQTQEEPPVLYSPVALPPPPPAQAPVQQQVLRIVPTTQVPADQPKAPQRALQPFPEPPKRIDLATMDIRDEDRAVLPSKPASAGSGRIAWPAAAFVAFVVLILMRRRSNHETQRARINLEPSFNQRSSGESGRSAPPWSLALIQEIEWKRFEDLTAAYFRETGYSTETQRHGADGGVDIWLHDIGKSGPSGVVQCKSWGSNITVKVIRELLGVMAQHRINTGYVVCSSGFTEDAKREAARGGLILVDGKDLLRRIQTLPMASQERLRRMATEGDYKTPSCASCGRKLVLKTIRGAACWVCQKPFCKTRIFVRKT